MALQKVYCFDLHFLLFNDMHLASVFYQFNTIFLVGVGEEQIEGHVSPVSPMGKKKQGECMQNLSTSIRRKQDPMHVTSLKTVKNHK